MPILHEIKEIASSFLDLIYPPVCAGCGNEWRGDETPICRECLHEIRFFSPPICPRCGAPGQQPICTETKRCRRCPEGTLFFDRARSVFSYKDPRVKNLIQALKFDRQTRLAAPLSRLLSRGYDLFYSGEPFDAIVPVPLHKSRLREREFNQAALLCQTLQTKTGVPIREDLVFRVRRTPPQYTLDPQKRRKNLARAFVAADETRVQGLRILLVDDVMTTGATINAVSAALRSSGSRSICALTLAMAIDYPAV